MSNCPHESSDDRKIEQSSGITRRRAIQLIGASLLMGREALAGPEKQERHERLESDQGPVHVWHPAHNGELEETIVFVKGDGATVDRVWNKHRLANQFRDSYRKALFVAIESPLQGWKTPYKQQWGNDLLGLVNFVTEETGIETPDNVMAIGHSAGYRTIATWLSHIPLNRIILSDALYGRFGNYRRWTEGEGSQLTIVTPMKGAFTEKQTANFLKNYRQKNGRKAVLELNEDIELLRPAALNSDHKVIALKSKYRHADQVRKGKVIPAALRLLDKSTKSART